MLNQSFPSPQLKCGHFVEGGKHTFFDLSAHDPERGEEVAKLRWSRERKLANYQNNTPEQNQIRNHYSEVRTNTNAPGDRGLSHEAKRANSEPVKIARSILSVKLQILAYVTTCMLGAIFTNRIPESLLSFNMGILGLNLHVALPLAMIPALVLLSRIHNKLNDSYLELEDGYVRLTRGACKLHRTQVEIPFESILFVELGQSIVERLFNVGSISVGRNPYENAEITLSGVSNPQRYTALIKERIAQLRRAGATEDTLGRTNLPVPVYRA